MARIRTIKPSFFRSEDVSALPLRARLTWIGLWTHCDDQGRAKDNARLIKGDIWPLDEVSLKDIEEDLSTLAGAGRIVRYEVDGRRYLSITNWGSHQRIQKPTESKLPPPPEESSSRPVVLSERSGSAISRKGREGKGREGTREDARPTPRCPKHQNDEHPPPCGACAEARRALEAHDADADTRRALIAEAIDEARADPRQRCEHGTDGGSFLHPDTGKSATCAHCRRTRAAS